MDFIGSLSPLEFILICFLLYCLAQFLAGLRAGLQGRNKAQRHPGGWLFYFLGLAIIYLIFAWPNIVKNYNEAYDQAVKKENKEIEEAFQKNKEAINKHLREQELHNKVGELIVDLKRRGVIQEIDAFVASSIPPNSKNSPSSSRMKFSI